MRLLHDSAVRGGWRGAVRACAPRARAQAYNGSDVAELRARVGSLRFSSARIEIESCVVDKSIRGKCARSGLHFSSGRSFAPLWPAIVLRSAIVRGNTIVASSPLLRFRYVLGFLCRFDLSTNM